VGYVLRFRRGVQRERLGQESARGADVALRPRQHALLMGELRQDELPLRPRRAQGRLGIAQRRLCTRQVGEAATRPCEAEARVPLAEFGPMAVRGVARARINLSCFLVPPQPVQQPPVVGERRSGRRVAQCLQRSFLHLHGSKHVAERGAHE
jgi:hypothetical protein